MDRTFSRSDLLRITLKTVAGEWKASETTAEPPCGRNTMKHATRILVLMLAGATAFAAIGCDRQTDEERFIDEVKQHLAAGKKIDEPHAWNRTFLHRAALDGYVKAAEFLLANGAVLDAEANLNRTPLFLAAQEGHMDMVRFLLDQGPNVNGQGAGGSPYTPFAAAVFNERYEVADYLIQRGADINARSTLIAAEPALHRSITDETAPPLTSCWPRASISPPPTAGA